MFSEFVRFTHYISEKTLGNINNISHTSSVQYSSEDFSNFLFESIEFAITEIDRIISETESIVLNVGDNLQKNYSMTKEVTGSAVSITNLMAGSGMLQNINSLNEIIDKSGAYLANSLNEIESGEKILKEVLTVLNRSVDNLGGFNRIVKHLRMLGISTKIESARLNIEDSGFTAIADNVDKLSTVIHNKADDIRQKSLFLISTILKAQVQVSELQNEQHKQTDIILSNTRSSLESLLLRYNNYSDKSNKISNISENVAKSIGEIVSSIQMYDITRQQFEHVRNALNEVKKKTKFRSVQSDITDSIPTEFLCEINDICELQKVQLGHSKDGFIKAVNNINYSLSLISKSLSELSDNIFEISSYDAGNNSFIFEVERGLKQTADELIKNHNINKELIFSMKSVGDTVGNLNSYVNEIDEIGTEVEMIALNARVKAAHTGNEGAALGVLAESIQRLSGDARSHTIDVSETLMQIMKYTEELKKNTHIDSSNMKLDEINNMSGAIDGLLNSLLEIDKTAFAAIDKTKSSILTVKDSIHKITDEFNIQNTFDNAVSEVCTRIAGITTFISKFNVCSKNIRHENVKAFNNNYTTTEERNIHERLANVKGMVNKISNPTKSASNNTGEFGDNVELF